jgi:hypothetical protein
VSGPDDLLRRSRAISLDPFMRHQVARFDARQEWRRREAERLAGEPCCPLAGRDGYDGGAEITRVSAAGFTVS